MPLPDPRLTLVYRLDATQITRAALALDWLNKRVFVGVAGRQAAGVVYETHLVA